MGGGGGGETLKCTIFGGKLSFICYDPSFLFVECLCSYCAYIFIVPTCTTIIITFEPCD